MHLTKLRLGVVGVACAMVVGMAASPAWGQAKVPRHQPFPEVGDPIWICWDPLDPPDQEYLQLIEWILYLETFNLTNRWPGNQGDPINLTWSLVPDGTMIPQTGNDEPPQGALASNLFATFDAQFGSRNAWLSRVQQSFDRWEELTGINFTRVTTGGNDWDDGAAYPGTAGDGLNRGDIRIAGRCVDGSGGVDCTGGVPAGGNILAYNRFPANGGDMVIDTADNFAFGGTEVRLRNLLTHELGHGIGLRHVCPTNITKLMEPIITLAFDGPQHDDIRATQVHYGDPFEADNSSGAATNVGILVAANPIDLGAADFPAPAVNNGSIHSIDANGERDFYRFTINASELIDVTLTPIGLNYDSSTQNNNGTCNSGNFIDSEAMADLAFEIIDTDGSTVLVTVDSTGAGNAESIADFPLPVAGQYFLRVYESNSPPESQLYGLFICINEPPVAMCQSFSGSADADCCLTVTVADVDDGSFDPNGVADIGTLCITHVDGVPVGCQASVDVCDDGTLGSHTVTLTITDLAGASDSCDATITITDDTPPDITCPPDVTITCGESTDPADTGTAAATDNCDPDPLITFNDVEIFATCPADPVMFTIVRTWTATDDSGNQSSCLQVITILKVVGALDIKPGSCPNSYNPNSHGFLPVGLLGTADFNVADVVLSTLRISRGDCVGGTVAPNEGPPGPHTVVADVGTPFGGPLCQCHTLLGDGIPDLSMKFRTNEVVSTLQLDTLPPGVFVELVVTGELSNGCEFVARDCIRVVPPTSTLLAVSSNLPEIPVHVSPPDQLQDGGGVVSFERIFEQGTLVTLSAPMSLRSHPGWVFSRWLVDGVEIPFQSAQVTINGASQSAEAVYVKRRVRKSAPPKPY